MQWSILALVSCLAGCHSFRFEDEAANGRLHLLDGDKPVLTYCYGDQLRAGLPGDRTRSSYIHPVHGMDGEVLTEDFPADHTHHRGVSLMWPRMKVGSEVCQLWHIEGIRSLFGHWVRKRVRGDSAVVDVHNDWVMDDGRKVATELLSIEVHRATKVGGTEVGRAIDVRYEITARTEPITLQGAAKKGYGGLNLRSLGSGRRSDTVITTDRGHAPRDSLHQTFAWVDMSARFDGRTDTSGITVFVSADHPGFPPPWMLRHYGNLNVAWPGLSEFVIQPGKSIVLEYRIYVHRDGVIGGRVAEAYRESCSPK